MMPIDFWWRGALFGFAIAAPVGPIGLLCIQRTLIGGQRHGLISGLGAATADALYGCVAAFGLTVIATFLVDQRLWLGMIGGAFLCYLGLRTFLTRPAVQTVKDRSANLFGAYLSTLFLTLTNPMTIFSFIAIFAGMGLARRQGDVWAAAALVLGVFCGSAAWWLLLSGGVAFFRSRFTPTALHWVNRTAGVVILGFGVWMLAELLRV
jgi:threonine/homoserine/homoserine lactone efflux protein